MSQRYWTGKSLDNMTGNKIFVFGSNPEGRHGLGAAEVAMRFGAKYGIGRGLVGNTYALVTKNLKAGFTEQCTGIKYEKKGKCSVSLNMIGDNAAELFECARQNPKLDFYVIYQNSGNTLNGYSPSAIVAMMLGLGIPDNVLLHDSFKTEVVKEFKLVVAGGREFKDFNRLCGYLDHVLKGKVKTHKIVIVCGMARGADQLGARYALLRGYEVLKMPASWDLWGKSAGYRRNEAMAKVCDAVIACWDGQSRGTKHMIDLAEMHKKPLKILEY